MYIQVVMRNRELPIQIHITDEEVAENTFDTLVNACHKNQDFWFNSRNAIRLSEVIGFQLFKDLPF